MKCEDVLLLISGHMDGENTAEEERLLQEHLEKCEQCREVLRALTAQDFVLTSLEEEPPSGFCDRVMEAVKAEQKTKRNRKWWPMLAAAAAVALIIGLGAEHLPAYESRTEAVPMIARSLPEEPVAYAQCDFFEEVSGQIISEVRRANVVETTELLPEMESCPCETMEDGSSLYLLPTAERAAELSEAYGLPLFVHPDAEEAYALLIG